MFWIARNGIS
jgi:transposase